MRPGFPVKQGRGQAIDAEVEHREEAPHDAGIERVKASRLPQVPPALGILEESRWLFPARLIAKPRG
jgi:hypothetical protein